MFIADESGRPLRAEQSAIALGLPIVTHDEDYVTLPGLDVIYV